MKSFIIFLVLATSIVAIEQEWRMELLNPCGFRLLISHINGIERARVTGQIFEESKPDVERDEYAGEMILRSNGWWTYENLTTVLNTGDKNVFVIYNTIEQNNTDDLDDVILDVYEVQANATRVPA